MSLEIIILAAGQGTRMKSSLPKVLHSLAGRSLLQHVVDTASQLNPSAIHVVTGHGSDQVRRSIEHPGLQWVEQEEQLGTGHAVMQAMPAVSPESVVLVLYGDVPLTQVATLRQLVALAEKAPALLTAHLADPQGYGRIVRDANDNLVAVVEHKDANEEQRKIREINTGLLAAPCADLERYLPLVKNDNKQGEYYLPDVLSLAVEDGKTIGSCCAENELEILGVNDRVQLNQVEREYQRRLAESLMRAGVSLADASRLDVRGSLTCAEDVSIDVNVVFEGTVVLGSGVKIGANCVISNAVIGDNTVINPMSHIDSATIGTACSVGPFARLRPGTVLADKARIGNFVETKNAQVGAGSKVNHLTYIGDCDMGSDVNIGAGTITCNYDGVNKYRTTIGSGVFVGSNSTLVAPLDLEVNSFVGAGSTVTKKVAAGELAVGRARQRNIAGWDRPAKKRSED